MTDKNLLQERAQKSEDKKAAVLGKSKKRRFPAAILLTGILLLAGGAATYIGLVKTDPTLSTVADMALQQSTPNTVSYPVDLFDDGRARHFEYKSDDITIRYFILKSADSVIRAAFDACDVCWPAGKGYYQEADHMVCRNCGRRFASVQINEVKGGCNPAPLDRKLEKGKLNIEIKDIQKGRQYFNFNERA
jgi:uncharacterized membrane protein